MPKSERKLSCDLNAADISAATAVVIFKKKHRNSAILSDV